MRLALAALLLLAAGAARGQAVPEIPFQKFTLGNGLTLVVHEDPKAPIAAVNVWYHVGSKNERPGKTGFAHLFEHLMFDGSEHAPGEWSRALDQLGATGVNGTTNEDRTVYFQTFPATALDTVLWLESDRMGHLLGAVTQAKLDQERGVVQNEKRQGENAPYGRAYDLITAAIYPRGHPYSWSAIGSMEDLNAATLDDVKEWFRTWYGPSNAVVVVAGDVKTEEVRKKVEQFFGAIPPGPPLSRHERWVAKRSGAQRQAMEDRVAQPRLYLVWNTAEWGAPDDDLLDLAARVLGGGKASRLYRRLVVERQLATDVYASQGSSELGSNFEIVATAKPGADLDELEPAVSEEVARFAASGPAPAELRRVRTERIAAFVRATERIGGYAGGGMFGKSAILAEGELLGGRPDFYKVRFERMAKATPESVRDAARRWLSDGVYALHVKPFPKLAAAAGGTDRSKAPEPGAPPEPSFPAFTRHRLSNGLPVIVAERRAVPIVGVQLVVDAGYASDAASASGAAPGTARLAGDMLAEGAGKRTSEQIAEGLAQLGAQLSVSSDLDATAVSLSALRERLDASLELLADVALRPTFPEVDVARRRAMQLAAIGREATDPGAMALRVLPRLLYGPGHAYAQPFTGSGTREAVEKLSRADLDRWHRTWFRPGSATLVVVGDTSAAEILPRLERLFGGWKGGEAPRKNVGPAPQAGRPRLFLLDRPGAPQSFLIAGQLFPPRANSGEIAQATMNAVLGGQFASRLNANLREEKHWSYGAYSRISDARGPRPFLAIAPVQADKTKEALAEVLKELRAIRSDRPVTAEELSAAKIQRTLTLPGRWEASSAVAQSLAELVRFGFSDDYPATYAGKVRALSLADVAEAARLVEPDRLTWVVVGDRAQVEAGLKELGLGEPVRIDAEGNAAR